MIIRIELLLNAIMAICILGMIFSTQSAGDDILTGILLGGSLLQLAIIWMKHFGSTGRAQCKRQSERPVR